MLQPVLTICLDSFAALCNITVLLIQGGSTVYVEYDMSKEAVNYIQFHTMI